MASFTDTRPSPIPLIARLTPALNRVLQVGACTSIPLPRRLCTILRESTWCMLEFHCSNHLRARGLKMWMMLSITDTTYRSILCHPYLSSIICKTVEFLTLQSCRPLHPSEARTESLSPSPRISTMIVAAVSHEISSPELTE